MRAKRTITALRRGIALTSVSLFAAGSDARGSNSRKPYYGKYIGTLASYAHGIEGTAFAVDENIIFIEKFSYDGTAPGKSWSRALITIVSWVAGIPQRETHWWWTPEKQVLNGDEYKALV